MVQLDTLSDCRFYLYLDYNYDDLTTTCTDLPLNLKFYIWNLTVFFTNQLIELLGDPLKYLNLIVETAVRYGKITASHFTYFTTKMKFLFLNALFFNAQDYYKRVLQDKLRLVFNYKEMTWAPAMQHHFSSLQQT